MLIKYTKEEIVTFGVVDYYSIKEQVLEKMNERYTTNDFKVESIYLSGDKYYDVDKGDLFVGDVIIEISQSIPYGQEPEECFEIKSDC